MSSTLLDSLARSVAAARKHSPLLRMLDNHIGTNAVIWSFPLLFLAHDAEEIATMEDFISENLERFPQPLRALVDTTTPQISVAAGVEFALASLASLLAIRSLRTGRDGIPFFTTCVSAFFLHAFAHIAQPLILRRYTPGVTTAILVILPYSLYTFHRLFEEGLISHEDFRKALLAGAMGVVPLIVGSRQVGKLLAS